MDCEKLFETLKKLTTLKLKVAADVELPYAEEYYKLDGVCGLGERLKPSVKMIKGILTELEKYRINVKKALPEKSASEALNGTLDSELEWFGNMMDDIFERVDVALDNHSAQKQGLEPKAVKGSSGKVNIGKIMDSKMPGWGNDGKSRRSLTLDALNYKPQNSFEKIDNSTEPFIPKLSHVKSVPSACLDTASLEEQDSLIKKVVGNLPQGEYSHPLQGISDGLIYESGQLEYGTCSPPKSMEFTKFVFVDTEKKLEKLKKELESVEEMAVDLEAHSYRSFQGLTCLMQISTRKADYIVDTLALWTKIGPCLSDVFSNPKIVKVLHGANGDIRWLQRDFGIYMVNMFDTYQAALALGLFRKGLDHLLDEYCSVKTDKKYQLADWRVRPLSQEMLLYARTDTHFLLFIYDKMRQALINQGDQVPEDSKIPTRPGAPKGALGLVLERSRLVCLQRYEKPPLCDMDNLIGKNVWKWCEDEKLVFCALVEWREEMARHQDESRGYIMRLDLARTITENKPRSMADLKKMVKGGRDRFAHSHLSEILSIILDTHKNPSPGEKLEAEGKLEFASQSWRAAPVLQEPIVPQSQGSTFLSHTVSAVQLRSDSGGLFGKSVTESVDLEKKAQIEASFSLPFNMFVEEKSEKKSEEEKNSEEMAQPTTAKEIRGVMDQLHQEEDLSEAQMPKGKKRSMDQGAQSLFDMSDMPLPLSKKYKGQQNQKGGGALKDVGSNKKSKNEAVPELNGKMSEIFKVSGLEGSSQDALDLEVAEIVAQTQQSEQSTKKASLVASTKSCSEPDIVIPFDYKQAECVREESKKELESGHEQDEGSRKLEGSCWENDGIGKPRKSTVNLKSGNKIGFFG